MSDFRPEDHPGFIAEVTAAAMGRQGKQGRDETSFTCPNPGHPDKHPSASWNPTKGLWSCPVCHYEKEIGGGALHLADLLGVEKPHSGKGGGGVYPPKDNCNTATPPGCTLAHYAEAKGLPLDFLRGLGLRDFKYWDVPSVRIPFFDPSGREVAVQFRQALQKPAEGPDTRFKWKSGSKTITYGLDRLDLARERGEITIGEGASDAHTLWYHGEPAIGLPGAANWNDSRDAHHLDGFTTINVVIEPDSGGDAVQKWVATSSIRDRVRLVDLAPFKDPSAMHLDDPERFLERWQAAKAAAIPWTERAAQEADAEAEDAWTTCQDLAKEPNILARVAHVLAAAGVAGEARIVQLLYLIVISRFLARPVSATIKGPSSGGKSYTLEQVLTLSPESAYYALSAMSEKALAYGTEPLSHRFLVIYEAAGLASDFASYLMRSLLSEGRLRYETVEKTSEGLQPRLIEREGPTGLLVTTTATRLHPENETRLLSLAITDTPDQTRAVFEALATDDAAPLDLAPWHALQTWLGHGNHDVVIPYRMELASRTATVAVRLRRDFGALLALIRAHAILHQASREEDAEGRIIATLDDYGVVRGLVADLIAEGVESTVPATVRETVNTVAEMTASNADDEQTVSIAALATALKLDKSATSRRVRSATDRGYLKNMEERKGRPAKIAISDPLPDDVDILPTVEDLAKCCSVAGDSGGIDTPPPSEPNDADDPIPPEPDDSWDDGDFGEDDDDDPDDDGRGEAGDDRWTR